jgi:Ala-tRNA(Pro) deacylase
MPQALGECKWVFDAVSGGPSWPCVRRPAASQSGQTEAQPQARNAAMTDDHRQDSDATAAPPAVAAKTPDDLFAFLDALSIATTTHEHAPVFTVAESQALRDEIPGGHTKNLFLKDKKGRYFLLTVGEEAEIDLKRIHTRIGAQGRVSFGKPEALMALLGVVPGAVTCFGVINDADNQVTLIFDEALMEHEIINGHPLRNDATTSIARDDLKRFVEATGHAFTILNLSAPEAT